MKTIEEFNAGHAAVQRRLFVVMGTGIALLLLGLGLLLLLCILYIPRPSNGTAVDPMMGLLLLLGSVLPGMIVFLGGGWWVTERWAKRDGRTVCPHCGKVLWQMQHSVVATRNCPVCGKRVVADPVESE